MPETSRLACVTGRFQPVHHQHLELFALALADAEHLVVAVTNPDVLARQEESTSAHRHTAGANPFTYFERVRLLTMALQAESLSDWVTVVPFDLTRPDTWADYVPLDAHHFVRAYSPWERHKADLLREHGYEVTLVEGDSEHRIASTEIRETLRSDPRDVPRDSAGRLAVPAEILPALQRFITTIRPGGAL